MNGWIILLIILGVICFGLLVLFLESYRELHTFRVREYSMQLTGHPKGRVLFLSDYHEAVNGKMNRRLLAKAKELKPDLILIGGDMVNGQKPTEDFTPAISFINGLTEIAPVYYAYGNHEKRLFKNTESYGFHGDRYLEGLSKEVHFLNNKCVECQLPEGSIRVCGLDMPHTCFKKKGDKLTVEMIRDLLGDAGRKPPTVLLAHDPTWAKVYEAWGAELTLAGHFHGGIIRIPLIGGIISPKFEPFPHYEYGYYPEGDGRMIVTCGVGQHTIPVRFNNLPELVLVNLD